MNPSLDGIRPCLEGAIPAVVATCDDEGIPNITYVSQIHYVNTHHVALSFQFFNKTRRNMLKNPQMTAYVIDPETTARYRLALLYLRTETEGPLFQHMKAKLAGIASHTGMSDVFKLQGADVCRVLDIEKVPAEEGVRSPPGYNWLSVLRQMGDQLERQTDLSGLFDECLNQIEAQLDIHFAMVLMADESGKKLYTVASRGYAESGVGSEIPYGMGIIGVAAEYKVPIRITHKASEYGYSEAIRDQSPGSDHLETAIPFPGLSSPNSQLAVPVLLSGKLLCILYVESDQDMRFRYDDEDGLVVLGRQLAYQITRLQQLEEPESQIPVIGHRMTETDGATLTIRFYASNNSIFLNDDYLIKGVAGTILWRLLQQYKQEQRTEFSNRELRLDKQLNLPEFDDNLEARLILLQRRLLEKSDTLAIVKTGRGRFSLKVTQTIQLLEETVDQVG